MPPNLALAIFVLFVAWLLYAERKLRGGISAALWIPIVWIFLLGSRPASYWFSGGDTAGDVANDLEGSPVDRLFFLALIVLGLLALSRRRVRWSVIFRNNQWVLIYFLYLGLSTIWSDYPFVSLKRWIKDLGNVVMVLLVLSERDPVSAVKAVFLRTVFLMIPLSVYAIKYDPEISRYYDQWTGQAFYCGLTTNKNSLGMVLFVSGLFLLWRLLDRRAAGKGLPQRLDIPVHLVVALMTLWLFNKAHSSTAITCTFLGVCILVGTRIPAVRQRFRQAEFYGLAVLVLLAALQTTIGLGELAVGVLERDVTLTGRTDIWKAVLKEDINPVTGVGFYSFWLGDRAERLSRQYHYPLNEAHNGYIETYLNSGLIGVFLLLMVLFSAWKRIKRQVMTEGFDWGGMRLAILFSVMFYNLTEATFNRLCIIWLVLLFAVVECSSRAVFGGSSLADQLAEAEPMSRAGE